MTRHALTAILGSVLPATALTVAFAAEAPPPDLMEPDFARNLQARSVGARATITYESAATAKAMSTKAATSSAPFSGRFLTSVGAGPRAMAVADLDLDGRLDVVVANRDTNDLSVLLGSGPGAFAPESRVPAGARPRDVAVGDLDGDGLPDVVAALQASSSVAIFRGDGRGNLVLAGTQALSESPGALALADFDGDGRLDLVATYPESDKVALLRGRGDGRFLTPSLHKVGRGPVAVAVADLDGDGDSDLAVASRLSGSVSVLSGNGDGTLRAERRYSAGVGPFHLAVGDLDLDGRLDLVVADIDGDNLVWLAGTAGGFAPGMVYSAGKGPSWVALGDFDADGAPEVVVANFDGGDLAFFTRAPGGLAAWSSMSAGDGPRVVSAADLDGDHRVDLVVTLRDENAVGWMLNEGPLPVPSAPPVAEAGADQLLECGSADGTAVALDGSASSDPDGDIVSYEWFLAFGTGSESLLGEGSQLVAAFAPGVHDVTLRVTDSEGASSTDTITVAIEDTVAPELSLELTPSLIWPPNHQMVPVHATVVAHDACGEASVMLVSVTSSQPDDGDIEGADAGLPDFDFLVRAERDGQDPAGRVYTVVYAAVDAAGNAAEVTGYVVVPHDSRRRK